MGMAAMGKVIAPAQVQAKGAGFRANS